MVFEFGGFKCLNILLMAFTSSGMNKPSPMSQTVKIDFKIFQLKTPLLEPKQAQKYQARAQQLNKIITFLNNNTQQMSSAVCKSSIIARVDNRIQCQEKSKER